MADLSITASNVVPALDGKVGQAGEAMDAGDLIYYKKSDSKWYLAAAATDAGDTLYAICVSGATAANQQIVYFNTVSQTVAVGAILTQGTIYVMSPTSGKLAEAGDLTAPVSEVQTVSVSGATSGTFTLTFDGQTTAAIAYNASAATVETALEALSNIDAVSVSGGPLNSSGVAVTFGGTNADKNVAEMTVTDSTDGTASVATTTPGYSGDFLFIAAYAKSSTELELILKRTAILVA